MDHVALRVRTNDFALAVARLLVTVVETDISRHAKSQLLRAATSVAANYRAVSGARSHAEFRSKLAVVVEEADECVFWLDYLVATEAAPRASLNPLLDEARQLARIFGASRRTAGRSAPSARQRQQASPPTHTKKIISRSDDPTPH
jgi:four helix bundle protein